MFHKNESQSCFQQSQKPLFDSELVMRIPQVRQIRNAEVVQRRDAGESYKAIASEFGLSMSRIEQIVKRSMRDKEQEERSTQLFSKIRMIDDIDKKWPTETIVNGLQFPWKVKQSLKNRFCKSEASDISLRDIMDFLITNFEVKPVDIFAACPAYQQSHVGLDTYDALLKYFSENDFGCQFGVAWKNRLKKLICFVKEYTGDCPQWLLPYAE